MWLRPPATGMRPADRARPVPPLRPHHVGHVHPGGGRRLSRPRRVAVRRARAAVRGPTPVARVPLHRVLRADRPAAGAGDARADPARRRCCGVLAVRSWARYESFELPERNPDGDGLATPSFWDGRAQVGRLRSLHVAAMFATIDAVVLYVLLAPRPVHRLLRRCRTGRACRLHCGHGRAGLGLRGRRPSSASSCCCCCYRPWWTACPSRASASRVAERLRWIAVLLTAPTIAYAMLPRTAVADLRSAARLRRHRHRALRRPDRRCSALLMLVVLFQRHRGQGRAARRFRDTDHRLARARARRGASRPASPTGWPTTSTATRFRARPTSARNRSCRPAAAGAVPVGRDRLRLHGARGAARRAVGRSW